MNPSSRRFKKEYSVELLDIAKGDLESAKGLLDSKRGRKENVLYVAEQAIEKSLKAVLIFEEKSVPITHDLAVLIALLGEPPPDAHLLAPLTDYATIRRYEEGQEIITHEDLGQAISLAENVLSWAIKICAKLK